MKTRAASVTPAARCHGFAPLMPPRRPAAKSCCETFSRPARPRRLRAGLPGASVCLTIRSSRRLRRGLTQVLGVMTFRRMRPICSYLGLPVLLVAMVGCTDAPVKAVPPPPPDPEVIFDDPDCICCTPEPSSDEGEDDGSDEST